MECEFSVELAPGDPTLAVPWRSPNGSISYIDLRRDPAKIAELSEVREFPELAEFLRALNTGEFATAKCDAWFETSMDVDDEPYGAAMKCAGYIDVFFANDKLAAFEKHEERARSVVQQLRNCELDDARAEIVIRRAYFHEDAGFYWTIYPTGYGRNQMSSRSAFSNLLKIVASVIN